VACICFGPSVAMLLLGVLILPVWISMLAVGLANPEHPLDSVGTPIWLAVWPICYVAAGVVGLGGLIRVLTLSRRERPRRHRAATIGAVTVGLAGLAIFDWASFGRPWDLSEGMPFALFVVLPFGGAAWLLAKSWKFLFAGAST
jgi:hypothetical protein